MREIQIKQILVPTDLSQPALIALQYGRVFADRFSAHVLILYVDPTVFPPGGNGLDMPYYFTESPEYFAHIEKEIRAYADQSLAGVSYDVLATAGLPAPLIVREADDAGADLIVMSTRGLHGWRRVIQGSVTESVLQSGGCPVLTVTRCEHDQHAPGAPTKILCPINFTDAARDSVDYAAQLACAFSCELVIVHIVEEQNSGRATQAEADVRTWIQPSIQNRCSYREIVLRGNAADRVLDCAEDIGADLLVIGAQHRLLSGEAAIGATTKQIIQMARVPVLTVARTATTDRSWVDTSAAQQEE